MENWNGSRVCRVFAAGQNASGELGLGLSQNVVRDFAQVQLPGGSNCELLITAAACGGGYSVVFDALNCRTYTCGEQDGVGGLSKPKRELVPLPALCGVHLIQLSCGLNHSLALTRARMRAPSLTRPLAPSACTFARPLTLTHARALLTLPLSFATLHPTRSSAPLRVAPRARHMNYT